MKKPILIALSLNIALQITSQDNTWITHFESSNYEETHTYEQTIEYCQRLSKASPLIQYFTIGKSARGYDIPLLIIDKNGYKNPSQVKETENVVLMVQAAIHPGEPDGLDAILMLSRDIGITKKLFNLLEHVTILFIPIFNADGHNRMSPYNRINQNGPKEMGWRTNSLYHNLNRDFLKADAPAMKAWLQLYTKWLPDFLIDCHTTDGADYQYTITYIMETYGNMNEAHTKWQEEAYLPYMYEKMEEENYLIFPYVAFRSWFDPTTGMRSWVSRPAFSQGYTAIQNRPGLLVETHMLKDYKTRVFATYEMIKYTLVYLNEQHEYLKTINKEADEQIMNKSFRKQPYAINYEMSKDCTIIEYKGFEYIAEPSDLTGGTWFKYTDKPKTYQMEFYNTHHPSTIVNLPEAYIIPPEWEDIIERLELHGVKIKRLAQPVTINVQSYKFNTIQLNNKSFEGHQTVTKYDYNIIDEERTYLQNSAVIEMNQRTAKVIAHALEPDGPDSYFQWGFFNALFEQKEYSETYVMEKKAREMIKEKPELHEEFEKLKANGQFFNNQWMMLNWFYQQSEYFDPLKNVYPVGKIFDEDVLEILVFEK